MATVNYIPYQRQSAVSLGKVAGYVSQDEKTQGRRTGRKLVSGVRCSSHFAVQEFRATRAAHHKKSPVWFYHYTQSFSPKEPITGPQAHQLAKEFAEQAWPESQVLVATHVDARHIHSHFLVNAVCYESGKMLRQGPRTLEHLRDLSDQLCMKYRYSVLPRERPQQGQRTLHPGVPLHGKGPELEAPPDGSHRGLHGFGPFPAGLHPQDGAPWLRRPVGGRQEVYHLHHPRRDALPG